MVTHDPGAAAHSDLVLFLADGRIVDEMERPTAEAVLERMRLFAGGNPQTPGSDVIRAQADARPGPTTEED
jgi:putative ABC transport system ATP-binding protein